MGYKYQNYCHETLFDAHVAFAQDCHASGSATLGSIYLSCTADPAGHVVMQSYTFSTGNPGTPWNYIPQTVTCNPAFTDQTTFMWQLALILVAGFAIRATIRAFQ